MRAKYWVPIIILLLLIAGFLWWRNAHAPSGKGQAVAGKEKGALGGLKPTVSVASVDVTDIDEDKIKMNAHVLLSNPLPVTLTTQGLDYVIMIDSVTVIKDVYKQPITIRSSDSTAIKLPLEVLSKPLASVIKYFDAHKIDSADYTMKATVHVDVPVAGERSFDINMTKRLPAIRMPKIKAGKIDFDKVGLKESALDLNVRVENPNLFPLKMKDGKYSVTIDKDEPMEGTLEKIINIPAKGSQDVTMHVDMKTGKVGKMALKVLFDKKDTHFKMHFQCKLMTENKMLNNSNMAFNIQGTLDELKDALFPGK